MSAVLHLSMPHQPLLLDHAMHDYLSTLPTAQRSGCSAHLDGLHAFLGQSAPLLAYTRLTGEAWMRTLPAGEQPAAARCLENFRAFLRDSGWLDAARPVNQPD